jgi:hypothetical protein
MTKLLDITGKRFGRITVANYSGNGLWNCVCDCGNEKPVKGSNLKRGLSTSCGCYRKERLLKCRTKHGKSKHRSYKSWKHIKDRCFNKDCKAYPSYGGRGITMSDSWRDDFDCFYREFGIARPDGDGWSVERIDNNGNYEIGNVKWATMKEQTRNQRRTKAFVIEGKAICYSDFAKMIGVSHSAISNMVKRCGTDATLKKYRTKIKAPFYYEVPETV